MRIICKALHGFSKLLYKWFGVQYNNALNRDESCGGHFREEHQTEDGEAVRNDKDFAYVAAWEFEEVGKWNLHKEMLEFESVELATRSYK